MATSTILSPKHYVVVMLQIFSISLAHAQDILWERSYGGKQAEHLTDAIPTADYGFIVGGSSLSSKSGNKKTSSEGDFDYWIWKMDEKGEPEWQKSYGGTGNDFLQAMRATVDGGFILAGNSDSPKGGQKTENPHGEKDFWLIKLDAGGGEQWQKTIGGNGDENLKSILQTKDGGYILGGASSSELSADKKEGCFGNMDYWIIKLDKEGKIQWQKTFGGKYFDELRSIEQTHDNGYIVGGYSNSPQSGNKSYENNGSGDYWILKLNLNGEVEWEKVIGGDKDDQLYVVHQTFDHGYILGGNSDSAPTYSKKKGNGKGMDFWIVKLNSEGEMEWQETYDFGTYDMLSSVVENKDHTFLIGGYARSEVNTKKDDKGINDYIAFKISEKGNILWQKVVGSDGDDLLRKLIETRDGGYILAGTSNPSRTVPVHKSRKSKNASFLKKTDSEKSNQNVKNAVDETNEEISEAAQVFNEQYNKFTDDAANKINSAVGSNKDSALQFGINRPNSPLGKTPSLGEGSNNIIGGAMENFSNSQATTPGSGDMQRNYGNSDFWIVKLRDKMKTQEEKNKSLEAMPNPTSEYTNVIVAYDYENGTATIVDISGHILNQFPITGRTIPVDLSPYPEGVYVINIKTNIQSDGIKVVKNKK